MNPYEHPVLALLVILAVVAGCIGLAWVATDLACYHGGGCR